MLERLHPKTRPEAWLKALAEAGVPYEGKGATLYRLAHALTNAEDAIKDTHVVDKMAWAMPPKWGCWAGLIYLAIFVIAAQQQDTADRFTLFGQLLLTVGAFFLTLLFFTWLRPQLSTLQRHAQTGQVTAERDRLRDELVAARDAFLAEG